jgi:hypothetical protein
LFFDVAYEAVSKPLGGPRHMRQHMLQALRAQTLCRATFKTLPALRAAASCPAGSCATPKRASVKAEDEEFSNLSKRTEGERES